MDVEDGSQTPREAKEGKLYPDEFMEFYPFACLKFGFVISLEKIQDDVELKLEKKNKNGKSKIRMPTMAVGPVGSSPLQSMSAIEVDYAVRVIAKYTGDALTQLTFRQCKKMIPWQIFRILLKIVHFYNNLYSITINSGIDGRCLHEINKILKMANITEINLDGTCVPPSNYSMLLENVKYLQVLSLSRCKLDDEAMGQIIKNMQAPNPAHYTLLALNVSSNKLTDETAFNIAQMLRANRKLSYLNLNGNKLTAHGGILILNVLTKFTMTDEEYNNYRGSWIKHLRIKQEVIDKFSKNFKGLQLMKPQKKTRKNELLSSDLDEKERFDKIASEYADSQLGEFDHPFHVPVKDKDMIWCLGNNTLAYLGVGYNNITYPFLQKLLEVLQYQKMMFFNKRQRGIVNLKIEGNPLPIACSEYKDIDSMLTVNLVNLTRQRKSLVGRIKRN